MLDAIITWTFIFLREIIIRLNESYKLNLKGD